MRAWLLFVTLLAASAQTQLRAPEQPNPKTLIPPSTIEAIVAEVSGSTAFNHILDIAGYDHDRRADEYATVYREAAYIEKMAKLYGMEDVKIERFPQANKQWDGEIGELWLHTPAKRLLISYRDIPASLSPGSKSADVTAELIYVGRGTREADYQGRDVKGKIVLASGSPGAVHNLAVRRFGAAGVASFNNPVGRPIDRPDQIAWNNLGRGGGGGGLTTFAFNLSHRIGMELVDLLETGEKVTVRAKVKTAEYDAEMQVPTAVIRGNGSSEQEVVLVGHLFEGIAKQGALDDGSGCATILEIGRAWVKLIAEGALPRPRRTVRFLWVPEISGSNAYVRKYPEVAKRMVSAVSMDMVGANQTKNGNSMRVMQTPYSSQSFINDVMRMFFEFVGDTNREKVHNRRIAYAFMYPILDPQGSRDPFYFHVEKHYGASDHTVFLGRGIPSVLLNNWPDIAYHTSEDRPNMADPTQLKRVAFIGLASAHLMANADGQGAVRIAETSAGYAAERAGADLRLALQMVGDGGSLREALAYIRAAYAREEQAIRSSVPLAEKDSAAVQRIENMAQGFAAMGLQADLARVSGYARILGLPSDIKLTTEEETAAKMIPKRKPVDPDAAGPGGGGGRGGGGQGGPGGPGQGGPGGPGQGQGGALAGMAASEALGFADGKRSILDIRDAVSAEFGMPHDVSRFVEYFKAQEKAGRVELVTKQ